MRRGLLLRRARACCSSYPPRDRAGRSCPLALAGAAAVSVEAAATSVLQEVVSDDVRATVLGINDSVIVAAALVGSLIAPVSVEAGRRRSCAGRHRRRPRRSRRGGRGPPRRRSRTHRGYRRGSARQETDEDAPDRGAPRRGTVLLTCLLSALLLTWRARRRTPRAPSRPAPVTRRRCRARRPPH